MAGGEAEDAPDVDPGVLYAAVPDCMPGERVLVAEVVDGWARLEARGPKGQEQWMLVDGASVGLGPLLQPAPPPTASAGGAATGRSAADDSDDDDGEFGG